MTEIAPKDYHQPIPHDVEDVSTIDTAEKDISPFEKRITSLHNLMRAKNQLPSFDAVRRAAEEVDGRFTSHNFSEEIPTFLRHRLPAYGERRILAIETVLCELGYLSREALGQAFEALNSSNYPPTQDDLPTQDGPLPDDPLPEFLPEVSYHPEIDQETYPVARYQVGDRVQVNPAIKPGHIRTPVYLLGKVGKIVQIQGHFLNPEDLAHFKSKVLQLPLYLVEFTLQEVWQADCPQRNTQDTIRAEIYEPWLSPLW